MDAFGYNIENRDLMVALEERAAELPHLIAFDDEAETVSARRVDVAMVDPPGPTAVGTRWWSAPTAAIACREAAGIDGRSRALDQSALTFNVAHTRPHHNVSTEFHTAHGPCVFVPLPGRPLQHRLGRRAAGSRAADGAERRRIVGRGGEAVAFDARQAHGRARAQSVSAGDRAAEAFRRSTASRWSAKPPMWCRRSARRASTWGCATPAISPTSCARRWRAARISGRTRC